MTNKAPSHSTVGGLFYTLFIKNSYFFLYLIFFDYFCKLKATTAKESKKSNY